MPYEEYRANVDQLCKERDIPNDPEIPEDRLRIKEIVFRSFKGEKVSIEATPMNKAGRLFVEDIAGGLVNNLNRIFWAREAPVFFTPELWNDCSPTKRPLVYQLKNAVEIEQIIYKVEM
ncbi:MAG: hypothetical protein JWO84_137 [Parcubacteria group bacterium]|nr:hypothetical protein [Parcubacteria group bacterium]